MGIGPIIILLACATLSLSLMSAAWFVGWIYRRDLRDRMKEEDGLLAPPPNTPFEKKPRPEARDALAEGACREARRVNAYVRRAHVTAWLLYVAAVVAMMLLDFGDKLQGYARPEVAYAFLAPQLSVITSALRLSMRQRFAVFAIYAATGVGVLVCMIGPAGTVTVVRSVALPFALAPMVGLWFVFSLRLQPFVLLLIAIVLQFGGLAVLLDVLVPQVSKGVRKEVTTHPEVVLFGLVNIVFAAIVVGELLRRRRRRPLLAAIALALAGTVVLCYDFVHQSLSPFFRLLSFVAMDVLQVFILWLVFKLLVVVRERHFLTNELLQTHLGSAFVTFYFAIWAVYTPMYRHPVAVMGFVVALAVYLAILHVWLFCLCAQRSPSVTKRLLLLRVFGRADEREDLLEELDDTWRRIGVVDLIAATDVASRTLHSSMLEAFLLQRSDEEFLRTESDVDARLANLRSEVEADVRYPVNGVFCYLRIWHRTFALLAEKADVVLMDFRGFTPAKKGSAWELAYLVRWNFDLSRIVLLGDRDIDFQELDAFIAQD
jgi:hypothetical protein